MIYLKKNHTHEKSTENGLKTFVRKLVKDIIFS